MRQLAIGDIHGCFRALSALADAVGFSAADRIITLGDYVDRGPDSRAVLDWLIEHRRSLGLISLTGNHELMMRAAAQDARAFDDWMVYGGEATLRSYSPSGDAGTFADVPDAHWEFLDDCVPFFETQSAFFVHACAYPDIALAEQPDYMLYWEKFDDPPPHESGKVMVCGHTPQKAGDPRSIGHAFCIDTFVHGGGWLTCLDAVSGRYWQANEEGETRSSWVEIGG